MPISYQIPTLISDYGDPAAEVHACRNGCALFDFSFVQRAEVTGPHSADLVEKFVHRAVAQLEPGTIRYALRLRDDGTVLSDLTVWKMSDHHFEIMSGHPPDLAALAAMGDGTVSLPADDTAIFAVQGPRALESLSPLCTEVERLAALRYFEHSVICIGDVDCRVGRLGYSGEAGFELIVQRSKAEHLWSLLSSTCTPSGFIAADILRIEAGFPLFWNDFAIPVTPHEAGLSAFSLAKAATTPNTLKRICFSADTAELPQLWRFKELPARPSRPGEVAVTSAGYSTRADSVIGLAYVLARTDIESTPLFDPTGVFTQLHALPLPFYDRTKARPRAEWT